MLKKADDIFLSYSHRDEEKASEIAAKVRDANITCFLAKRGIKATEEWSPKIRDAIKSARCVLMLLTPRSIESKWVTLEAGAAWVLEKDIVPATMFVETEQLIEPIKRFQVRPVETDAQVVTLIQELQEKLLSKPQPKLPAAGMAFDSMPLEIKSTVIGPEKLRESFTGPESWDQLQKIGEWMLEKDGGIVRGEGMHHYLLSQYVYGRSPFRIKTRIRFNEGNPQSRNTDMNAGVLFGWKASGNVLRYFNLLFTGKRILLELIGEKGGPVFHDYKHIDEGAEFLVKTGQLYEIELAVHTNSLLVVIDGHKVYECPFNQEITGRVGLRPWRSKIDLEFFEVSEVDA